MNKIKILVSFEKNEMIFPKIEFVRNDYNHVEFLFSFDEDNENSTKVFELKKPDGKVFIKEIVDNKVCLYDTDASGKKVPVINQSGLYEFEITKYTEDSKFTISKVCQFMARDEIVNIDDDIVETDVRLSILDDLINDVTNLKKTTEIIATEAQKQGEYAKKQGDYAKEQSEIVDTKIKKFSAQEEIRKNNEDTRIKNEKLREASEEQRSKNETDRISNEKIRVANEEIRVENEKSREEYVSQLKQDVADGKFNGECNFATFEINLDTGNLEMNKTEGLLLDFAIENGNLEVLI